MQKILVSLAIRTRQCVFAGNDPCGHHGICQEVHRDILNYIVYYNYIVYILNVI